MENSRGRDRRKTTSSASHRHDPDLELRSTKDVNSASSSTAARGDGSNIKGGPTYLSPPNDTGKSPKFGALVSSLAHPDGSVSASKARPTQDRTTKRDRQDKESNRSKQPNNDTASRSRDVPRTKTKQDDRHMVDPKSDDVAYKQKDKQSSDESKSSQTPKNKRRARSASRPRDTQLVQSRESSSPTAPESPSSETAGQARRASIPVIWLSREDGKKHLEITEDTEPTRTHKRRLSALSQQAKLAFEKVAMAVTETESVEITREKPRKRGEKGEKNRKTRSQSTPRETIAPSQEKISGKKKKSHTRHLSRDMDTPEKEKLEDDKDYAKSMQQLVPKQQHRKTDANRKQDRIEGEISLEGVSAPAQASQSTARKSSITLKLFHSITSNLGSSSSTVSSPQRQPTPSRPRKKYSRGHIDQDPLEVDYEILDDRVTSLEPRKSIPSLMEQRRSVPTLDSPKASAEEPLLSKHREADIKLNLYGRESLGNQSAQRPSFMPYMQTFPRTKQQQADLYTQSSSDRGKSIKTATSATTDRSRPFSSYQLNTPDSLFSSLHKISSQSSFTSSDARSDVCLDLPDVTDNVESDLHFQGTEREKHDFRVKVGFPNAPYNRILHYTQFSILLFLFSAICNFIGSFILLWPLLVVVICIVPLVVLVKRLLGLFCCCGVSMWGRCCLCLCHTHLTSSELLWLGRASEGGSSVVQSLLVLQKGLDTDRIRNLVDSRLLSMENRHGRRIYPRFTQKVVAFCCGHAWVTDHHFVVSRHVFNMPGYIETLEDLQQFISKMAGEPLSLDHPLWEIQILHNFREPRDTVLLFRMHACMTDGVSLVHVLENALVDSQKTSHSKRSFSAEVSNTSPFKVLFSGPITFLSKYICQKSDFNLLHGGHVRPSGEMVVAWSEPFSLSAAMRVKQVARCTLSELLLSITAGNIRTYLQVSGITHPFNVKCAVPVDFQAMNGGALDMENKYSLVVLQLPTNTEGAIPRLWQVKYNMVKFKSSAEAAIVNGARWLTCCLLPVSFFQRLWRKIYSKCTLLVANLAGPTSVLKIDSREVKCMMYWVPPMERVPLTVSFITYADQIRMAVISERSVIPNPDLLTRDFNHKLEILSKLLAHRRIPGETASTNRNENIHLLSSFTLDDLTAEQIQLEMSLVQQELHDLKVQLDSGPSNHISHNDTQLMSRIEALKARSRELMMYLRRRKADETENAVVLSEEDDLESEIGTDKHQRPFRRRTLSMSSKMSTASVSSTARPLSTASTSNLPSPIHTALPSWPEGDLGVEDIDEGLMNKRGNVYIPRSISKGSVGIVSPVSFSGEDKGRYHSIVS